MKNPIRRMEIRPVLTSAGWSFSIRIWVVKPKEKPIGKSK